MQQKANEDKYQRFIERVVETGIVWGLSQDDAWATSTSNEFDETEVILFWSDEAGAAACAEDDWADYETESVTLVDFLENWCVGMYADSLLLGPDWNKDLLGREVEPLEVALAITEQIEAKGKTIDLTRYDNLKDFKQQILDALEGEE